MKPRIALIGCGMWGKNHARTLSQLKVLKMACDENSKCHEVIRSLKIKVPIVKNSEEVFASKKIDAVVIATPAATHFHLAKKALEAGKDILVEKPLALSVREGEELVRLANNKKRILLVGHVLEYHPAILKLKGLIADGSLGKLQYIYSNRLNMGRIRTEENALWNFAPHDIAVLLRLMKTEPSSVSCSGGNYLNKNIADTTVTLMNFPSGVKAHIFVSWLHPFKLHRLVIIGDRKMAVFDDTQPWENKLILYPHRIDWLEGRIPVAREAKGVSVPLKPYEPLQAECEEFLKCIKTRKQPLTNGESGVKVLEVLEAAQASLVQEGQPMEIRNGCARSVEKRETPIPYFAHSTAVVDIGAEIQEGTKIWHFSHVMSGAKIGRECVLGQNVFVGRNVEIGNHVKVQNNVSIYEEVILEDDVFCGPSVVFTNVINPRSRIERKHEYKKTLIRRAATLGANCTIICGVTIGRYAFVGAGAVVTKDVPDYALVCGVPARLAGWMCECGLRLKVNGKTAICRKCGKRYRKYTENEVKIEL